MRGSMRAFGVVIGLLGIAVAAGPAMTMEMDVVGKEAGGYWVETRMAMPDEMISKSLIADGGVKRTIVKAAGQPAMEMPSLGMQPSGPTTDLKERGTLVGTEKITTPGGTFECRHYRMGAGGNATDAWVADGIAPYGLVKVSSPGMTLVLTKVVTGATTRITEEPMQLPSIPGLR